MYEEPPSSSYIQGGSRMRESRSYGSVRGALSNERPYREHQMLSAWSSPVALTLNVRLPPIPTVFAKDTIPD